MKTAARRAQSPSDLQSLKDSLLHLERIMESRLRQAFALETAAGEPDVLPALPPATGDDPYSRFVRDHALDDDSQLLLLLALSPWAEPGLLDRVIQRVLPEAGDYPLVGGVRGRQHRGFLPTGDTALFLLAGTDLEARARWQGLLWGDHPLARKGVVQLQEAPEGEPAMSGRLELDPEYAERFLTGRVRAPRMSFQFPAQRLETERDWDELVLPARTLGQVQELMAWVRHERVLMDDWGMARKLPPGCRALFYGPPGTGKTFTATLLGKCTGREVYKVDLSMVVSKYIGETEKNLARLFDKAENKEWILFFDEADALFGKRTQVRDSHDRFANQEVSFLLQRVETFQGLVILASNLATNVDEAFARRFEQVVHFPMPRRGERRQIWQKGLPAGVPLEPGADLDRLAERYELSGGMIMNAIRHACLCAIDDGRNLLRLADVVEGIRREYTKENRVE
jgi:ATPase family protein associated with various cellular activities (AAA)